MSRKRANGEHSRYRSEGRYFVAGYLNGKRCKVSRKTYAEATKAWEARVARAALGSPREGQPATMADLLEDLYETKVPHLRYSTLVGYRHVIDAYLTPAFGRKSPADLTVGDIERWQNKMLTQSGLGHSTIQQCRVLLSQALNLAVRHGDLVANPVQRVPGIKKGKSKVVPLTEEEARALLRAVPGDDHYLRARILIALTLGLRQGEVLGLTWGAINLDSDRPSLTVRATLQRRTGHGLVLAEPKTDRSRRTLALAEEHVTALRALRLHQRRTALALGDPDYNNQDFVFLSSSGTPVDPANDRKMWFKALDAASVRRVRVHDSRHTAATLMLGKGQGIHIVQQILGHTSIRTTVDVYGHLTPDAGASAIAIVTADLCAGIA